MVIYYADDKPQDAWKRLKTWVSARFFGCPCFCVR